MEPSGLKGRRVSDEHPGLLFYTVMLVQTKLYLLSLLADILVGSDLLRKQNTMNTVVRILAVAALVLSGISLQAEVDESPIDVKLVRAFPKLRPTLPVVITNAGDDSDRLFIVNQKGVIHWIPNDDSVEEMSTFLDIGSKVFYLEKQNEEGLLGLAFHPEYKQNGYFYVYYTTTNPPLTSVLSRFSVSKDDPNRADPNSEMELMRISQPFWNHNGGSIEFGPDGYLYIGLGDGGKANDTKMHGQNVQTLLGSVLRIDVNSTSKKRKYGIPRDNPFVDAGALARPEIYAYGFRNPWRLTFDSETGDLWVADVGQNIWEEINLVRKGGNYGWNLREGKHKFGPTGSKQRQDLIDPIWEYDHEQGKSITGGHVYRGKKVAALNGYYLYSDYVSAKMWALKYDAKQKKSCRESQDHAWQSGKALHHVRC